MDDKTVARGVSREKTRESLAVFMAIGATLAGWLIGAFTQPWVGVAAMIGIFVFIWRWYSRQ